MCISGTYILTKTKQKGRLPESLRIHRNTVSLGDRSSGAELLSELQKKEKPINGQFEAKDQGLRSKEP